MERRNFMAITGAAALSIGANRILGANDRVNLVQIGIGGRGSAHLKEYLSFNDVNVAGLCDVNQAAREKAQAAVARASKPKAKEYTDMREVFSDKDVDAVSMATPNHWHALGAIWAMEAGKDVYVEKPASWCPFESIKMVEAARKYKRMCQVGSQSRSMPHKIEAVKELRDGVIGQVYMAKALCYKRRKSIGHKEDEPTPPGVDWNMFLGPAAMRPFNELRFRYNWHWFWDTGNGDIGNQGVHEMDVARWGLGVPESHEGLKSVVSTGGKYLYTDDQETPNTQNAVFDYGDKQLVFEVRGLITGPDGGDSTHKGVMIGDMFYGNDGVMELTGAGYRIYRGEGMKLEKEVKAHNNGSETGQHMRVFLSGVKSRNLPDLTAEIAIGAASADLCHFANIAYRVGHKITWNQTGHNFGNDPKANALMKRNYRKGFVVPEKV